jgi:hypothetical protein
MKMALAPSSKIGLDGNSPLEPTGCPAPQMAEPRIIAETGTSMVRLNFILGPWSSPADRSLYCGKTWFETFDAIVDGLLAKNVAIYGLVGLESVKPGPGDNFRRKTPGPGAEDWLRRYVENVYTIVEHFSDRVWVFELINEPNNWFGGTTSLFHPYWMARIQKEVYLAVKPKFNVRIISGPILAHDLPTGADTGASYLRQMYYYGIRELGWGEVKSSLGSYPLDGVGYHPYIGQTRDKSPDYIQATLRTYLNAIWESITLYEGKSTSTRIYVSEIGWDSEQGDDFQAAAMAAAFYTLLKDERVQAAVWFCLRDFPGTTKGLYTQAGFGSLARKPIYYRFQEWANISRNPALLDVPVQVGRDASGRIYWPIIECYLRHGGEKNLGLPFDNGGGVPVHRWGNGWVQDFQRPDGSFKSIIMLRDGTSKAYILYGPIRDYYIYEKGGAEGPLGYPVEDPSTDEWGLPKVRFERGMIAFRPMAFLV